MTNACRGRGPDARPPRGKAAFILLLSALILAGSGFTALGVWQLERLQWKLALIERVDSRIHAAPTAAPPPAQWPTVSAARDEYKHVRLQGRFLSGHDTRVQALTALGAGFWVLSPFQTDDGALVLVNRGFVPPDWPGDTPPATTTVTGLLRLSEPGGAFLRRNDAAARRWYSRDVVAITAAQGLARVAPYFVDMESPAAAPASATLGDNTTGWPRAGLTVTRFRNAHLGYALTWFALAFMCAGATGLVARTARRATRPSNARDNPPA